MSSGLLALALFALAGVASAQYNGGTTGPQQLVGQWKGSCSQRAYSNADGSSAFCLTTGATITFPSDFVYANNGGSLVYSYSNIAFNKTMGNGIRYYYGAYESTVGVVTMFNTNPRSYAQCLNVTFADGSLVTFRVSVTKDDKGDLYTEQGAYETVSNSALPSATCFAKDQKALTCDQHSYVYKCTARRVVSPPSPPSPKSPPPSPLKKSPPPKSSPPPKKSPPPKTATGRKAL